MERFSISFTLGKASAAHGANVNHNNRKFLADNINPAETSKNHQLQDAVSGKRL